jgi:transportin-3
VVCRGWSVGQLCEGRSAWARPQLSHAQTQRDFEELPRESSLSLRNSLVISYGTQSRPVFVQLCVALSSLAVHLPASEFGEGGVLAWLFGKLQQDANPETAVICMLEVLVTLPQVRRAELA